MRLTDMINDPVVTVSLTLAIDEWSPEYRALQYPHNCYLQFVQQLRSGFGSEVLAASYETFTNMLDLMDPDKAILLVIAMHQGPAAVANLLREYPYGEFVNTFSFYDHEVFDRVNWLMQEGKL